MTPIIKPRRRKRETVPVQQTEQPIGADATLRQLAGMIFAAAEEMDDPRLDKLADVAMGLVMEEPATVRGLLIQLAKSQQQPQHRPPNPFLDKMIRQKTEPQPVVNNQQFNELASQILKRLDDGPGNSGTDSAVDPSVTGQPATQQ